MPTATSAHQSTPAKLGKLGTVNFPTSTRSEEAQAHFLRGVAALHSFWYPVALDEFRAATKIDPDFMMGYWGEAMTYNHPIWSDPQETEAARKAIGKIRHTPDLTPRERAYLQAVRTLYGEGEKPARDGAYAAAMEKIYQEYPDDLNAATFYALSLLGTVHPEDPTALRTRMLAGAIAWDVYRKEPDHPGAAHYILHAFDDPDHAILALPAARHYAEIAPASHHAQHMPLHIFLQLGMWPDAAASNESAWKTSDQWVKSNNLPISQRDYHALHWLLYVYLQQGRYREAKELLMTMQKSLAEFSTDDPRMLAYGAYTHASMAAALVVETEQWNDAERLLPVPQVKTQDSKATAAHDPSQAYAAVAQAPAVFARGLAAAMTGAPDAQESVAVLRAIREQSAGTQEPVIAPILKVAEIQELEVAAVAGASKGDFGKATTIMQQAIALHEAAPPSPGPPTAIKPPHELYGEILLRAGRPAEAAQQFGKSLFRHPNRARSLLGAARAAVQTGDTQDAGNAYAQFSRQWRGDTQLPELREAEQYIKQATVPREAAK
ncbi:MAG: hypothetical protein ACREJU_17325 [Nitrospiraceae bacterium]